MKEKNIIQTNGGITIKCMYAKKIIFGILLHVFVKMENI